MSINLFGRQAEQEKPVVYADSSEATTPSAKQTVYPMPPEEQNGDSSPEAKAQERKNRKN